MIKKSKDIDHYFSVTPKCDERFGLIKTSLRGRNFDFLTSSSVFSKRRVDLGTHLLIETMILPSSGIVLDLGCGYGAVGIVAAVVNRNLRVVMTDINFRAIRLARQNSLTNKVFNVDIRQGDLYEPVKDLRFDCVFSNPPVSAGMDTIKAIIIGAFMVLLPGGSLQMVIRSKIGAKVLPATFYEVFGEVKVLSRQSGYRVLMGKMPVT